MEELIKLCNILFFIGCLVTVKAQGNFCDCSPCLNGGTCEEEMSGSNPFTCYCQPGYTGELCETEESTGNICDTFPCMNGGTCEEVLDGLNPFTCNCLPGYTGEICETEESTGNICDTFPCMNGGTCEEVLDGLNPFTCNCLPGYTGEICETEESTGNICDTFPCMNGGTCEEVLDGLNPFTCNCLPGYTGEICETEESTGNICDTFPCMNGGTCEEVLDGLNPFTCNCLPGYTGEICETEESTGNICDTFPCMNGGTCEEVLDGLNPFTCNCLPGYTGEICETEESTGTGSICDDPNLCGDNGACMPDGFDSYECYCIGDYFGMHCEISYTEGMLPCDYVDCQNGASCTNNSTQPFFTCECDWLYYYGLYCQHRHSTSSGCDYDPCQGQGSCSPDSFGGYECTCYPPYYGRNCEHEFEVTDGIEPCSKTDIHCENGGSCTSLTEFPYFMCNCIDADHFGKFCQYSSSYGSACDSSPCGGLACSPMTSVPYYRCEGPSYIPKDLETRVTGCEKMRNMTEGVTKTFKNWCMMTADNYGNNFHVAVYDLDSTKIYQFALVMEYLGAEVVLTKDVVGANAVAGTEAGFFDITDQVKDMEIPAPARYQDPATNEFVCLNEDAHLYIRISEQNNPEREHQTKKQRFSILCDFSGVDIEVVMTPVMVAGSTPPSILNDGSMLMGGVLSLVDTAASISINEGPVPLPKLGRDSGYFLIAFLTDQYVYERSMCNGPRDVPEIRSNDSLIYVRRFEAVTDLADIDIEIKATEIKAPNRCGLQTMVILVDPLHSIAGANRCKFYVAVPIYLEGCDTTTPAPVCHVIPNPYNLGQESVLTFQYSEWIAGISMVDSRMYKFVDFGFWKQELLQSYEHTEINDILNTNLGYARLNMVRQYIRSVNGGSTYPSTEADAREKVIEMEGLNPDESSVPDTATNIANLIPNFMQAFENFPTDIANIPLSADVQLELEGLFSSYATGALTDAQSIDNAAAIGVKYALLNISYSIGNEEALSVVKNEARFNICSTGDVFMGLKTAKWYQKLTEGSGAPGAELFYTYDRLYIELIAKQLALMKYFFDDAPFFSCLQKSFHLLVRFVIGDITDTAWLMDPCTNRPNNCLMKTKDFCRSQSDTCAEETNLVEGGNVDEALGEMLELREFIDREHKAIGLYDIADRMAENYQLRKQYDTSDSMSMMEADAETACRGDEWLLPSKGPMVLYKQNADGTVMVGKPNALKGTICWNPEAVCTCEECIPAASTSGSDAGSSDAGMTKRRKK